MYLLPARASKTIRVFSYGGGVQSNAVLALQAQGKLIQPFDVFIFANVGEDSENPDTLDYIRNYAQPFAAAHGIRFVEVSKGESLLHYIQRMQRSVPIPVYMQNGAPGNRSCTVDYKIRVIDRWIRDKGECTHAALGLGISIDEYYRVRSSEWTNKDGDRPLKFWRKRVYPLIDLRMRRADCSRAIVEAGLPIPPKSSCFFCPFTNRNEWRELKFSRPDLFEKAVALEQDINSKRSDMGRDRVYLHRDLIPLDSIGDQMPMFNWDEMEVCDSGHCFV